MKKSAESKSIDAIDHIDLPPQPTEEQIAEMEAARLEAMAGVDPPAQAEGALEAAVASAASGLGIHSVVLTAQAVHDAENWKLGTGSSRETRNAFWARAIGIVHFGHPVFNKTPDPRWHIKDAGQGRPQTDDVAVLMPSRDHWDCIPGVGLDGYRFEAAYEGVLPAGQNVFPPPKPVDTGPVPGKPTPPTGPGPLPPTTLPRIDRAEFMEIGKKLDAFYRGADGLQRVQGLGDNIDWEGVAAHLFDGYLTLRLAGQNRDAAWTAVITALKGSHEYRSKHGTL